MFRLSLFVLAFASLSAAGQNTYFVTGVGDGYWGTQSFTGQTFTFTFTADTSTFIHGTPCCASVYTTPAGTTASVQVNGFPTATLTGDQAIFADNANSTGGIWHYNDPEFLTVTNGQFATNDLSVPFGGYSFTGPAYSYATPMPLSTGDTLYFTSVHDVYFVARTGAPAGQPSAVSVTPASSTMQPNTAQTFSFVVSDTAGASDIGGLDILIQDPPNFPTACWLYYQTSTATMTAYRNGAWGTPVGIQSNGSTLSGDACVVDTTGVTVSLSGNDLTLTVPIRVTTADNAIWPIYLNAIDNENTASGYTRVGSANVQDSGPPNFSLTIAPTSIQGAPLGQSVQYTVTVQPSGGFDQPVSFSTSTTAAHSGNTAQLSATFDPSTVTGAGSTTMTVSTATSDPPDVYHVVVTGTSPSLTGSASTGPIEASNVPPTDTISPNTGTGSSQTFTIQMTDRIGIAGANLLVAPSLDGQNACWIFFDRSGSMGSPLEIYLASDDGSAWTKAGTPGFAGSSGSGSASNSQCSIDLSGATYDEGAETDNKTLRLPIVFQPGFAGTKTLFVRAQNDAGFDTGYQATGGWGVQ